MMLWAISLVSFVIGCSFTYTIANHYFGKLLDALEVIQDDRLNLHKLKVDLQKDQEVQITAEAFANQQVKYTLAVDLLRRAHALQSDNIALSCEDLDEIQEVLDSIDNVLMVDPGHEGNGQLDAS